MISKKVLMVSHSPLLSGGAELSLLEIAKYLNDGPFEIKIILPADGEFKKKLDDLGIQNEIVSYRWSVTFREDTGLTNDDAAIFNADAIMKAYEIISKFKPDVVFTNTIVVPWFGYAAKALGISHVMLISELYDDSSNLRFLPNDHIYLNQLRDTTDFIFYNSKFTASTYADIFKGIDSAIVYPTIKFPQNQKKFTKTSLKKLHRPTRLIVYGSIARHKNQVEAVRALSILVKKGISVELTILGPVGVSDYYDTLVELIDKFNLDKFVKFVPFMEFPFEYIHKHDIVLVPSLSETFGRVTAEAQALGRIVIGANVSATAELIIDNKSGYLYRLGDPSELAFKIELSIKDIKKSIEIARYAQKHALDNYININQNDKIARQLLTYSYAPEDGDSNFNYIGVLIRRNFYTNKKIVEYASALDDALELNDKINNRLIKTKFKKLFKPRLNHK